MTKVRNRWLRPRDGDSPAGPPEGAGQVPGRGDRITPTELDVCLRVCAVHSGKMVGSLDRKRVELAEKLRPVLAAHATGPGESAQAAAAGTPLIRRAAKKVVAGPTGSLSGELLDALLAAGNKGLECGYADELKLSLLISDAVLTQRKNSRAGWRLRARTLEAMGDEPATIAAYERYLALTEEDGFGVAPGSPVCTAPVSSRTSCSRCWSAAARRRRCTRTAPPPTSGPRASPCTRRATAPAPRRG